MATMSRSSRGVHTAVSAGFAGSPPTWKTRGGVMVPMHCTEAMCLRISACSPFALKIASGGIAVSGERWSTRLRSKPQNYVVLPEQTWLCGRYPRAVFCSGNAAGTDEVFAQAIASIDPERMEFVVPRYRMGRTRRPLGCHCLSLEEVPDHEVLAAAELSKQASLTVGRLAEYYARTRGGRSTQAAGRGMYLLRDTVKVMGSPTLGLAPAGLGIFFVAPSAPDAGGTGHTIRLCRLRWILVAAQREWTG